ncbi:LAETG motif-containing sortase-dependent surface protein [Streptomyces sp. 2A115]|uniref:LAETG motif-containing sortase-dependent surface protein n=1 Tax=Streptomyces sp. 2A115 TaxID=3457439 RepID=UPI003FD3D7A7
MKLRRAMAAAAATAVIAPLALLSAPVAFATEETDPTASTSESASPSASTSESESASASASASASESESASASASTSESASASAVPSNSESSSASASPSESDDNGDIGDEPWNPYEDCKSFDLDEKLTATLTGLPNKIVAGSGWDEFKFVVKNDSGKDLENVWVEALTEYSDDTNSDSSLLMDLAEIQVKEDGKWTSGYQDSFGDEDGDFVLTGSFVATLGALEKNSTATLDLRLRVKASAPAGSSFALSQAVYAGEDSACYGNGDFYDFTVLAAGTKPGDVADVKPNGKKPKGIDGTKPQGEVNEIDGNLAETGSSSALPTIGLVGGAAIVAGAGAVFVVRRRKAGVGTDA